METDLRDEQHLTHGDLMTILVDASEPPGERQLETLPDGWIVDLATGEVVGRAAVPERFEVQSHADADFVLQLRSEIEAEIVAVDARLKALAAQLHALRQQSIRKLSWWDWKFGASLAVYARSLLTGKGKTVRFSWGSVSFRATKGTHQIIDMDAAVEWMRTFDPRKVKTKEHVTVTDVLAVCAALEEETGDAERPGWLKQTEAVETVKISTGIEIEGR